jgi:cyclomaltodextrinase
MDDFIFGTLATDELRLEHIRSLRAGVTHNQLRIPRQPDPNQSVKIELTVGPDHTCDRAWVYWTVDGSDPQGVEGKSSNGHVIPMERVGVEWDTLLWGYLCRFRAELPAQTKGNVVRYRIGAGCENGDEIFADDGAYYAYYVSDDSTPTWVEDAIVYQIFVDRFYPGDGNDWKQPDALTGFFGGTLKGIKDKLDYLNDLGVNVLWLTPIFPSPSHHGYNATDFFDIEPRLGTKEDLEELLNEAHERNIRILLDFVPNHWSNQHPTFQKAIANADSPYRDWYIFRRWPDEYETFFGVRGLPKINLRYPAARQHVLDAAAYWLNFGVDGYRVDHTIGPAPDFWADFRKVTRRAKPDCWTFGEAVDPPDVQLGFEGGLDGSLDFVLLEGLRQTFAFGRWDARRFAEFLDRHEAYFPETFSRPSFLDNHDMNRILWVCGGAVRRLKLAALCQFTLIGPPVIYYGTEVGLSQERDVRQDGRGYPHESRMPMIWDEEQNQDLYLFYRRLIALRHRQVALRRGERETVYAQGDLLAYIRRHGAEEVLVALNLGDEPQKIKVDGAWSSIDFAIDRDCELTNKGGFAEISLPPFSGVVSF